MDDINLQPVIIDTETTGLEANNDDRIIQFAAVKLSGNTIVDEISFYINPQGKRVSLESYQVHGITNQFLEDKPTFDQVYDRIYRFIGNGPVIAHNAPFDKGFLDEECSRFKLPLLVGPEGVPIIDSIKKANQVFPNQPTGLDALCKRLGVSVGTKRDKHDALDDCKLLAQVWVKLQSFKQFNETQSDLFTAKNIMKAKPDQRKPIPVFLMK